MNIPQALEKQMKNEKPALIYFGKEFSYEDLGKYSRAFAEIFLHMGIRPGERIALMMSNVPQFVFAYYGAILAGAIVTPINLLSLPRAYNPNQKDMVIPHEILEQIKDANPKIIVAFDIFYPLLKKILADLKITRTEIILTGPQEFLPLPLKLLYPLKAMKEKRWLKITPNKLLRNLTGQEKSDFPFYVYSLSEFKLNRLKIKSFSEYPGSKAREDDIVQLQYTGGTTGIPKGVMLTHRNLLKNIEQSNEHIKEYLREGKEVILAVLPFFHLYGLTVTMNTALLRQKSTIVLVPDSRDIERWIGFIKKYKVTIIPSVPTLYERLATSYRHLLTPENFSSVRIYVNGAGVLSKNIRKIFEELSGAKILEGYGLSEASPVVSVCTPSLWKEGSIGKPCPETEVKIINPEDGKDVPAPGEGEIVVFGPQVMKGYWGKPDETAEVLKNGWLHTGDIGYLDKDGFLFITDRLKDMAKIKGENVFPSKIENAILQNKNVKEAVVVGVPDEKEGERLVALLTLFEMAENPEKFLEDIREILKNNLASHEIPKDIRIIETLDSFKNQMGKILKREIKSAIKKGQF